MRNSREDRAPQGGCDASETEAAPEVEQTLYDYPEYYDVLFGWDRDAEVDFYDVLFRRSGAPEGGGIVEIGCGTGQVALRLARRRWAVTGLDVRPQMLAFLREAARAAGVRMDTVCADMTCFSLLCSQDGACCPIGTFCILRDDRAALAHLRSVGEALRPGRVYIIDMEIHDAAAGDEAGEGDEWVMRRGAVTVRTKGGEVLVEDRRQGSRLRLNLGDTLRRYSGEHLVRLVEQSGCFAVEACFPEAWVTEEGISIFEPDHRTDKLAAGRVMVALRRLKRVS